MRGRKSFRRGHGGFKRGRRKIGRRKAARISKYGSSRGGIRL